ncbi:hypothetical protein B0I72DRAFT_138020 [Yarrowia lipolytica]|jgi:N6-adenosine-specific RNA methylase IME4|uniref:YALI0C17017p n=2 Tax=Yarrowia lipolytica TaxID=4952 RepID=Q6CBN3_YARLI|nr:YALI0C17017p [Yarrowia lipolytica CLIB122]AOW02999.1 hypothetical protein YALI1_C24400g [Yarrowia lipolytica]KAB8283673.1 hypothetical protein BKA91DRAFT_136378 [Yarrowia lipolytica]KAE8172232.1 hypothetical protein BKA90DRAFT_137734 [Yarrowia lipolytica]KAJ8053547.1 hypothetical protein LXG23DRAFT_37701 [Yarrowia lipolytica]QNP95885.1 Karyogamy protein KAR4 [Yarrowia lipolytica]|eukprot:XP_501929.1 YALI0C17017p [Yarrowia lipolytica CLIB122]
MKETFNFGNDYSDVFLHTQHTLPQSHVQNAAKPLEGYPRLQELHRLKAEQVALSACKRFGSRTPQPQIQPKLEEWVKQGLEFDVVMVGGCPGDSNQCSLGNGVRLPTRDELKGLPIGKLTPRPSIAFLWVPGSQVDMGRKVMESWGFRRSEDVVFFPSSMSSVYYPPRAESLSESCPIPIVQASTWHCIMGLKGTVRRSEDVHLINCNVDTDVIVESPDHVIQGIVPQSIFQVIENFALMNRRLHIVPICQKQAEKPLPVMTRPGWVILSPDVLLNNFSPKEYNEEIAKVGKLVSITEEIDKLRPKSPKNE